MKPRAVSTDLAFDVARGTLKFADNAPSAEEVTMTAAAVMAEAATAEAAAAAAEAAAVAKETGAAPSAAMVTTTAAAAAVETAAAAATAEAAAEQQRQQQSSSSSGERDWSCTERGDGDDDNSSGDGGGGSGSRGSSGWLCGFGGADNESRGDGGVHGPRRNTGDDGARDPGGGSKSGDDDSGASGSGGSSGGYGDDCRGCIGDDRRSGSGSTCPGEPQRLEETEAHFPVRLGQNHYARATRQRTPLNSIPEAAPAPPTNEDSIVREETTADTTRGKRPRDDERQSATSSSPNDSVGLIQRAAEVSPEHPKENHTAPHAQLNPDDERQVAEAYARHDAQPV